MPMSPRLLRPRQTGFNPRSISGLALWLDAADSSTLFQDAAATIPATATNDPVGAWLDKSGNGRHATQGTGTARPTISATAANGRRALAFSTIDRRITSPVTVAQLAANATTSPQMFFAWAARPEGGIPAIVWGTHSPPNPSAANRLFYSSDFGGLGSHIVDFGSISGAATGRLTNATSVLGYAVGNELDGVPHVYSAYRDGTVMSVRRDGVEILRRTGVTVAYTDTTGTLTINNAEGTTANTASWLEFLAVAGAPSAASITRIERYLAAKWGITLAPQVSNADAQDWINRVYANGGTVSATTASAVNQFCVDIENAGIRDRFYRLNLFCGNSDASLAAVRTPLFRGPSLGGTQYGGTTDTNVNFVQGDYAETGASGGLLGNGSSKYLDTGFNVNNLTASSIHLSSYIRGTQDITSARALIGALWNSAADRYRIFLSAIGSTAPNFSIQSELGKVTQANAVNRANTNAGHIVSSRTSTTSLTLYDDATSSATNTDATAETVGAFPFLVFARTGPTEYYNGRMAGYSIGSGLTGSEVTAFYNAMQAFQTALGRQV